MSKRVIALFGAVMLVALTAYAADIWKDKDFKDWDQKEVQKILADSPWVKAVQFGGGGGGNPGKAITDMNGHAPQDMSGGGNSGGGGGAAQQNFTISWVSSRTYREAVARMREFNGTPADEARKILSAPQENYLILVKGNNLGALDKLGEAGLKEKAYLMVKKTKAKVAPTRVSIQKGPDGRRAVAILFEFPKKGATGEAIIATDEKGVEFFSPAGNEDLKIGFDLTKMADKEGSDW